MYTVNKKCSGALKILQQSVNSNAFKNASQQELSIFKFNRDQIKLNSYSTKTSYKPIKKLMVANRGLMTLFNCIFETDNNKHNL